MKIILFWRKMPRVADLGLSDRIWDREKGTLLQHAARLRARNGASHACLARGGAVGRAQPWHLMGAQPCSSHLSWHRRCCSAHTLWATRAWLPRELVVWLRPAFSPPASLRLRKVNLGALLKGPLSFGSCSQHLF